MKIELMQLAGRDGDTAYNVARALAAIADCSTDTDLLVFPETHLMGFVVGEKLAGAGAGNRQGYSHCRTAGPRYGGQIRRPPAALSTGKDLRPCGPGHPALDTGAVGGANRRAASAAGRCAARSSAGPARSPRR